VRRSHVGARLWKARRRLYLPILDSAGPAPLPGYRCGRGAGRKPWSGSVGFAAACKCILSADPYRSRTGTVALPFCHVRLQAKRPLSPKFPRELKTLRDHILKRRLLLKLLQSKVASQLGVSQGTISRWESNETRPPVRFMPRIINFLGYNPLPRPEGLRERALWYRKVLGLSQRAMAKNLEIDPTTLARWERGKNSPSKKLWVVVERVLGSSELRRK
jgi:transcriptional regulator with XRE-family HTH domain